MGFLVTAGDGLNLATNLASVSPLADTNFTSLALNDRRTDLFWSQGSIAANSYARFDLNRVKTGGFDSFSAGAFRDWTSEISGGGVAPVNEAVIKDAGAYSCELAMGASAGYSRVTQNVTFRSGQRVRGSAKIRADGIATAGKLEIYNSRTGRYLAPDGSWQLAQIYYKTTSSTGSFQSFTLAFVVESYAACQAAEVALRCRFVNDVVSTTVYADSFYLWPEVNLCIITGHNIAPATPIQWRSSTDDFAANDVLVATLPARETVTWKFEENAVTSRYVELRFVGTPEEKIRATEIFWCYGLRPAESPAWGYQVSRSTSQSRSGWQTIAHTDSAEQRVTMTMDPHHVQEWPEIETEIFRRAERGQPIIAIPDHNREEIFIGRTPPGWAYRMDFSTVAIELPIEPYAQPIWVP